MCNNPARDDRCVHINTHRRQDLNLLLLLMLTLNLLNLLSMLLMLMLMLMGRLRGRCNSRRLTPLEIVIIQQRILLCQKRLPIILGLQLQILLLLLLVVVLEVPD